MHLMPPCTLGKRANNFPLHVAQHCKSLLPLLSCLFSTLLRAWLLGYFFMQGLRDPVTLQEVSWKTEFGQSQRTQCCVVSGDFIPAFPSLFDPPHAASAAQSLRGSNWP